MMDAADRALLADSVLGALDGAADPDGVLAKLGWLDMLAAEPDDAIAIVFEALGRTNAMSSAVDDVVMHALGIPPSPNLVTLIPSPASPSADILAGVATARVRRAREVLVLGEGDTGTALVADAKVEPIGGIDPDAGVHRVRVDRDRVTVAAHSGTAADAVALAQRAIAQQMAGACRTMLDLAREHALARQQFGRAVAQFQAVRHRLAEALVAIGALDATLVAAADAPGVLTAQLAKACAGRTARTVATHCQQVLAGIGFTTEHPFHRYLKRTMLLNSLFGTSDDLVVAIGKTLLTGRAVPTLIDL
jgi:alkylation response protein AidB-like acyl-CoA dehydrogenase